MIQEVILVVSAALFSFSQSLQASDYLQFYDSSTSAGRGIFDR